MRKVTLLKLNNCINTENSLIAAENVVKILPVIDKEGKEGLFVIFYDEEFCIHRTWYCTDIEFETKEINDENRF